MSMGDQFGPTRCGRSGEYLVISWFSIDLAGEIIPDGVIAEIRFRNSEKVRLFYTLTVGEDDIVK